MGEKKINVNLLKDMQLEILKEVDSWCKENSCSYWLDYGTLLGAIRHKGYIPWDDDIDISMLREDYVKLLKKFKSDKCTFICSEKSSKYPFSFGKIILNNTILYEPFKTKNAIKLGVYIDVFCYDFAPKKIKKIKKIQYYQLIYNKKVHPTLGNGNFLKKILIFLLNMFLVFIPRSLLLKKINKLKNEKKNNYIVDYGSNILKPIIFELSDVQKKCNVKFCGKDFPAPLNYDKWLTNLYGNWNELPPLDKQVSHHQFEAWYLEE